MSILQSNLQHQIEIQLNLPGSVAQKKRSAEEVGYHGRDTMASSLQRSNLLPITTHVDTEGHRIALDKRYKQRKLIATAEVAWWRQLGQCNAGRWRA
jgi:hypothetical protein